MVIKGHSKTPCAMCKFNDFLPGDVKHILEYKGEREHLCPACTVKRGFSYEEYYHQNKNAPVMNTPLPPRASSESESKDEGLSRRCHECHNIDKKVETTDCTMGGCIDYWSKERKERATLCLPCAITKGLILLPAKKGTGEAVTCVEDSNKKRCIEY